MARCAYIIMISVLPFNAACSPVLKIESMDYTANATRCIEREAAVQANSDTDVEEAARNVLHKCELELHSKKRALIASYPDHEQSIRKQWESITALRVRQARRAVVQARNNRNPRTS